MKLAIATVGEKVSAHFGHCDGFTVYTINNKEVIGKVFLESPKHEKGVLPKFLAENEVDKIIAGGMGKRAQDLFNSNSIEVIVGVKGSLDSAIESYLTDKLESTNSVCEEHNHLREDNGEGECSH